MTLLNRKFKNEDNIAAIETKSPNIKQVTEAQDFEAAPSFVHDLQNKIENQFNAVNYEDVEVEKIPFKYTLIGLIAFCSVFWMIVFGLFG